MKIMIRFSSPVNHIMTVTVVNPRDDLLEEPARVLKL